MGPILCGTCEVQCRAAAATRGVKKRCWVATCGPCLQPTCSLFPFPPLIGVEHERVVFKRFTCLPCPPCRPRGPAAGHRPDAAHGPAGVPRHQRHAGELCSCALIVYAGNPGIYDGCRCSSSPQLLAFTLDSPLPLHGSSALLRLPAMCALCRRWCPRQALKRLQTPLLRKAWRHEAAWSSASLCRTPCLCGC